MSTPNQQTPFIPLVEKLITQMATGAILKKKGGRFTGSSIRNYNIFLENLKTYEYEIGTIWVEDMNEDWVNKFMLYLIQKDKIQNTVAFRLDLLKSILKKLYKKKWCAFDGDGITAKKESTIQVYTSVQELHKLYQFDLSKTPGLEYVRDLYIMQAYTGLRWSDFTTFLSNISHYIKIYDNRALIEIHTQKTGVDVAIPVAKIVATLIEKYRGKFRTISQSYFNINIKKVARKVGFTENIMVIKTRKGNKTHTLVPKYKLIASHTARRSFVTNAFLAGIQIYIIMQMTGHRDYNTILKYIRATALESAKKVVDNSIFKRKYIPRFQALALRIAASNL